VTENEEPTRRKVPRSKESVLSFDPNLASQAADWDPSIISISHSKKLNWKCQRGHIWDATISHRLRKQNCPFCSSHRILVGFNDLETTHPKLAMEADGWDPKKVISDGHRNFQWKCEFGHVWENSISNRKGGQGCPYCKGKKVLFGFNDLLTLHPDIATEADGWDPKKYSVGSGKKLNWRCTQGHNWVTTIPSRVAQRTGCPYCSNYKTLKGYNDLATTHPDLAKMAFEWDPSTLGAGSGKRVKWQCDNGHVTTATVESRAKVQTKCKYCMNTSVLKGFNDLQTTNPTLAFEAFNWDPTTLTEGSNKNVQWKCSKGHIWKQSPSTRSIGSGCPYCSNRYVWAGDNDLVSTHPELARQANGWDPTSVGSGSGQVLSWKCELGHVWKGRVIHRARRDVGCPYCSNNAILVGFNDLATTHPGLAKQANGWDTTKIGGGYQKKMEWICDLKHIWRATVSSRSFGNFGCPYCSGFLVWPGFNDLLTTNPKLASEAFGWDPTKVNGGSNKKLKWKCIEGHVWSAIVGARSGGTGCPTCATHGFDPNLESWLYLLEHPDWEMFQIGITNFPDQRVGKHQKSGWKILELRGPIDGQHARDLETGILRMLKAAGAELSPSDVVGRFDGMTEAWKANSYRKVLTIKELVEAMRIFEDIPKIDGRKKGS